MTESSGGPLELEIESLSAERFAPFGEVIEASAGRVGAGAYPIDVYPINDGGALRRDHVAQVDVEEGGGRLRVSVARAAPRTLPLLVEKLERHPLGSQAFVPMTTARFLVVAGGGRAPRARDLRAFLAGPGQGVSYRRGVWHLPLSVLERETDFLVLDREGPGENLEERALDRPVRIVLT